MPKIFQAFEERFSEIISRMSDGVLDVVNKERRWRRWSTQR